jgi:hypothetical protein
MSEICVDKHNSIQNKFNIGQTKIPHATQSPMAPPRKYRATQPLKELPSTLMFHKRFGFSTLCS